MSREKRNLHADGIGHHEHLVGTPTGRTVGKRSPSVPSSSAIVPESGWKPSPLGAATPEGAAVLDLGRGPGGPRSEVLKPRARGLRRRSRSQPLAAAYRARPGRLGRLRAGRKLGFLRPHGSRSHGLGPDLPAAPRSPENVIENVARALEPAGHFLSRRPPRPAPGPICGPAAPPSRSASGPTKKPSSKPASPSSRNTWTRATTTITPPSNPDSEARRAANAADE